MKKVYIVIALISMLVFVQGADNTWVSGYITNEIGKLGITNTTGWRITCFVGTYSTNHNYNSISSGLTNTNTTPLLSVKPNDNLCVYIDKPFHLAYTNVWIGGGWQSDIIGYLYLKIPSADPAVSEIVVVE